MRRSLYTLQEKRDFAARMRHSPTTAESILWSKLRRNQFRYRFWQQFLLRGYIVDFYCGRLKLVIEVDGSVHGLEDRGADDEQRERNLENCGYLVLRFSNEDVTDHLTVVMSRIWDECSARFASLKGFDFASGVEPKRGEVLIDSRNRSCGSVEKAMDDTTVQQNPCGLTPFLPADCAEINDRLEKLAARYRELLHEFTACTLTLAKKLCETEGGAIALHGMHVTEPLRRKA